MQNKGYLRRVWQVENIITPFVLALLLLVSLPFARAAHAGYTIYVEGARIDSDGNIIETWQEPHSAGAIVIEGEQEQSYGNIDFEDWQAHELSVTVSPDYAFLGWYGKEDEQDDWELLTGDLNFELPQEDAFYQARFSVVNKIKIMNQPIDSFLGTPEDGHDYVRRDDIGRPAGDTVQSKEGESIEVQLFYDDGTPLTNAGGEVVVDIHKETGMPGAVIYSEAVEPDDEGIAVFDMIKIDRLGPDYQLVFSYQTTIGPVDEPEEHYVSGISDKFNIIAAPGTVLNWGAGTFGRLGVDNMGMPGHYLSTDWPHMHEAFSPQGESGYIGYENDWPEREWEYPRADTFDQRIDRYEPVQPFGQFDAELGGAFPYPAQYELSQNAMQYVAAGRHHSLALRADGAVFAWGRNNHGQLGVGSDDATINTLQHIEQLDKVIDIAAGEYHSLAVLQDGTVWAWGSNEFGQLGNDRFGPDANEISPVQVIDNHDPTGVLQGIIAVEAGKNHSYALKNDGSIRAWGRNSDGQLGDGGKYQRAESPVKTAGINVSILSDKVKPQSNLTAIAYNNDGSRVITPSADATALVWDSDPYSENLGKVVLELSGSSAHSGAFTAAAFSPCGRYIVTGGDDTAVKLWDSGGEFIDDLWSVEAHGTDRIGGHSGAVTDITTFQNGRKWFAVSGSTDRTVRVWELDGGELTGLREWEIEGDLHDMSVMSVDTTADGKFILVGSSGGRGGDSDAVTVGPDGIVYDGNPDARASLWRWDEAYGQYDLALELADGDKFHTAPVYAVAIDPQLRYLLTGSLDRTVRLWDFDTGEHILEFGEAVNGGEHLLGITAAAFCRFGDHILTGSRDATARLWKLDRSVFEGADGFLTLLRTLEGHSDTVTHVAFSPDRQVARNNRDIYGSYEAPMHMAVASKDGLGWLHQRPAAQWIAAGGDHGFAILEDDTPLAWGLNNYRQLGTGTSALDQTAPAKIIALVEMMDGNEGEKVAALDGGNTHSLALTNKGRVFAWGHNVFGQLGRGTKSTYELDIAEIEEDHDGGAVEDIIAIAAGGEFSMLRSESAMWGIGSNEFGELGINGPILNGDNSNQPFAYKLSQPQDTDGNAWSSYTWTAPSARGSMAGGAAHTLAVVSPPRAEINIHVALGASQQPVSGLVVLDTGEPGEKMSFHTGAHDRISVETSQGLLESITADKGTQITLRALSLPGYDFKEWRGPVDVGESFDPADPLLTFQAKRDITVTAHFESRTRTYELSINQTPPEGGIVKGAGTYNEGDEVIISARPFSTNDHKFLYWTGDPEIEGSSNRRERIIMTGDKTVTAVFDAPVYRDLSAEPMPVAPSLTHTDTVPSGVTNRRRTIVDAEDDIVVYLDDGAGGWPNFALPLGILNHDREYLYTLQYDHDGETHTFNYRFETGTFGECEYQEYSRYFSEHERESYYRDNRIEIVDDQPGFFTSVYRLPADYYEPAPANNEQNDDEEEVIEETPGDIYVFQIKLPEKGLETLVRFKLRGFISMEKYNPITDRTYPIDEDDIVEREYARGGHDNAIFSIFTVRYKDGGPKDLSGVESGLISDPIIVRPAPEEEFAELTVQLKPDYAQDYGAAWRISDQFDGEPVHDIPTDWFGSDDTVVMVEGKYEIEFRELEDPSFTAHTPSHREVELIKGSNTKIEADYSERERSSSSSSDECFIATAAYGSSQSVDVRNLRQFRDRVLLPTRLGHDLVKVYYNCSPPLARLISRKALLREVTAEVLRPLVAMSKIILDNVESQNCHGSMVN